MWKGSECRRRMEENKELARVKRELEDARRTFSACVKTEVDGQIRNHDACVRQPLVAECDQLRTDLRVAKNHETTALKLWCTHSLELQKLDLLTDKARLVAEVVKLRAVETAATVAERAAARCVRHTLLEHKRAEADCAAQIRDATGRTVAAVAEADRRVLNAEVAAQTAIDHENNAKRNAEAAGCTGIMKSLTMGVYMAYRRPTVSLMAHMKGMVMGDMLIGLGTRLRPRARAPGLDYAPREPSRRYASMAQKEPIGASVCAYGTVIRMSVHP